jgi:hypothetical protein
MMTFNQVLKRLKSKSNPAAVRGMARFGITAAKAYGWSTPALKKFAREIGKDHANRQAEPTAKPGGDQGRAGDPQTVFVKRALDCLGCAAGAAQPGGATTMYGP